MYESHITIEPTCSKNQFIKICNIANVKPLWIENDSGSNYLTQPMSKCFYRDSFAETAEKVQNVVDIFEQNGLKTIRVKIEWILHKNEGCKQRILYREFHSKFQVSLDRKEKFLYTVEKLGAHSATNSLKNPEYFFVTTRDEKSHSQITDQLESCGFRIINTIAEYVIYDSNPGVDSRWARPEECYECPIKSRISYNE